jgi:hypothetical protein
MDHNEAQAFAEQWVRDWNAHDIDALLRPPFTSAASTFVCLPEPGPILTGISRGADGRNDGRL